MTQKNGTAKNGSPLTSIANASATANGTKPQDFLSIADAVMAAAKAGRGTELIARVYVETEFEISVAALVDSKGKQLNIPKRHVDTVRKVLAEMGYRAFGRSKTAKIHTRREQEIDEGSSQFDGDEGSALLEEYRASNSGKQFANTPKLIGF